MNKITFFICMTFVSSHITAQDFNKKKMDSLFDKLEQRDKSMGSLSIFQDGEEVYSRTIGYADFEKKQAANSETKYRIGSITKTFTAVMIFKMVENGKLELSTKLSQFFPDLPNAEKIDMENLLNHTSGLFNFTSSDDYTSYMTEEKSREEMLDLIKRNGAIFEPGEKNEYSNTNYILLTYILEDLSGKSYSSLLQEMIVAPLNLRDTEFGGKITPSQNEARSYRKEEGWILEEETHMSIPLGAGGMISTPYDLNVFFTALFNHKLLSQESLDKMTTITDRYGLGLFEFPFHELRAFGHDGGIDGFSSTAAYFPSEDMTISFISNASEVGVNDILIGVLSIYFGKEYEIPEFPESIQLPTSVLEKYVGVYSAENFPVKLEIKLEDDQLKMGEPGKQLLL
ncbi:class A beta-lactamase-related serine hydrolase [Gramella sp. BOM4]|nr:class A beta-lactamase-related serine hydrolase [Christiangramia bathymodioli]